MKILTLKILQVKSLLWVSNLQDLQHKNAKIFHPQNVAIANIL